jgi:hypothetical protein
LDVLNPGKLDDFTEPSEFYDFMESAGSGGFDGLAEFYGIYEFGWNLMNWCLLKAVCNVYF